MIRRTPALRTLVAASTITSVAQGMFVVLYLAFVVREFGGGGSEIGLIRGVQAVGGVLGSIAIARLATRIAGPTLFAAGLLGMGVMSFVDVELAPADDRDAALHRPVRHGRVPRRRRVGRWADGRPAVDAAEPPGTSRRHARRGRLDRDGRRVAGGRRAHRPGAARRAAQRSGVDSTSSAGVFAVVAMHAPIRAARSARHRSQRVAQLEAPAGADDRTPVHHG